MKYLTLPNIDDLKRDAFIEKHRYKRILLTEKVNKQKKSFTEIQIDDIYYFQQKLYATLRIPL